MLRFDTKKRLGWLVSSFIISYFTNAVISASMAILACESFTPPWQQCEFDFGSVPEGRTAIMNHQQEVYFKSLGGVVKFVTKVPSATVTV